MERSFQGLLISATLAFSWLAMMVVHESGHVLHAWISGGRVARVVLHPWDFSYTELDSNPSPRFVAWGGPIWGWVIPLALWMAIRWRARGQAYLAAFFAGFCCIANGAYLLGGAWFRGGDAKDLLEHGTPAWQLALFGLPTVALGLYLWHGLGGRFGLGPHAQRVDRRAAVAMLAALALLVTAELICSVWS